MPETEPLFQLVVIGSSAGGIEALSNVVSTLPDSFPVPIVIAQHLDPTRPSHLASILSRHSPLPVVIVEQEEHLKGGTVYVVPSNKHVEITDHTVSVLSEGKSRPKPSVDLLLTTAAERFGEKLIAVILTGTGSDGTLGVRAVHESGGTVIAQNPATSAYPAMVQSLDPEAVHITADLPQIGSLLSDLVSGTRIQLRPGVEVDLAPFLEQLRAYSRMDFRAYKPGTILRRLQRRLVATSNSDLTSYRSYLQAHPEEYEQLIGSFLIKVTEFMRDPETFTYLQEQVLPELIEYSHTNNFELRIWSAGCATGQEAYSLAILVREALGEEIRDYNIKIFATDVDANAIVFARRGFYARGSLDRLSPELVERYFTVNSAGYEVKKQIRELIIFGEHDLSQRAPFPRIDLVLCRNVLIYFSRELQQHALRLFAFALRDRGFLVLGRSESNSPLGELFAPMEQGQRVYRRQGQRQLTQPVVLNNGRSLASPGSGRRRRPTEMRSVFQMQQEILPGRNARDNLLLKLPIGVAVVDERFDILEINSAARRMLSIHTSAIGEDLVHLAHYVEPRELGAAITKAIRENTVTTLNRVEVPHRTTGEPTFLQISCYPHPGEGDGEAETASESGGAAAGAGVNYALILITDVTNLLKTQLDLEQSHSQEAQLAVELAESFRSLKKANADLLNRNEQLTQSNTELAQAKLQAEEVTKRHTRQMELLIKANRNLLAANEELTMTNALLRTNNEEYMLHTEEAQAAIEEADTLNEEMQATNEELETLNEELQASVEELNTSNTDLAVQTDELRHRTDELREQEQLNEQERAQLAAILSSMGDAVLVVNPAGKVLLTNAAYDQTFGDDTGLVLLDETGRLPLETEGTPQALAIRGEQFKMTFSSSVNDGNRHWWEAVGQPVYREGESEPAISVTVLRDITERSLRRLQEEFLSLVGHELRTPLTIFKGYTQMTLHWLGKQAGDFNKPLHSLEIALVEAERFERLIADIGDMNQLQSGKFRLKLGDVRLDELVKQVVEAAQTLMPTQEIELESDEEPVLVRGDVVRLQQLLFNLLTNANTHAAESPKIVLGLKRLKSNQIELRVQDFGPGITPEYLNEVFSRFYQVIPGSGGLGLGLYISEQIVTAHGGTIGVESTEGVGTTFIVQLPALV